jgi:hypothetical protein
VYVLARGSKFIKLLMEVSGVSYALDLSGRPDSVEDSTVEW